MNIFFLISFIAIVVFSSITEAPRAPRGSKRVAAEPKEATPFGLKKQRITKEGMRKIDLVAPTEVEIYYGKNTEKKIAYLINPFVVLVKKDDLENYRELKTFRYGQAEYRPIRTDKCVLDFGKHCEDPTGKFVLLQLHGYTSQTKPAPEALDSPEYASLPRQWVLVEGQRLALEALKHKEEDDAKKKANAPPKPPKTPKPSKAPKAPGKH